MGDRDSRSTERRAERRRLPGRAAAAWIARRGRRAALVTGAVVGSRRRTAMTQPAAMAEPSARRCRAAGRSLLPGTTGSSAYYGAPRRTRRSARSASAAPRKPSPAAGSGARRTAESARCCRCSSCSRRSPRPTPATTASILRQPGPGHPPLPAPRRGGSDGLLLLDIQPGRADFAAEVARLDRYLREPDVGLALDPEWHVGPDEIPGEVIGSVDAATVNEISAQLAASSSAERDLPAEALRRPPVHGGDDLRPRSRDRPARARHRDQRRRLRRPAEQDRQVRAAAPDPPGPASFAASSSSYNEDLGLMSPAQVLELSPKPDLIVYE